MTARRPHAARETAAQDTAEWSARQRVRGIRAIAAAASGVADCALLLDALGLEPAEGIDPPDEHRTGAA